MENCIKTASSETIEETIYRCIAEPNKSACIICYRRIQIKHYINTIREMLMDIGWYNISKIYRDCFVFKNGSKIEVVPPNACSIRGRRNNYILVDSLLPNHEDYSDIIYYVNNFCLLKG